MLKNFHTESLISGSDTFISWYSRLSHQSMISSEYEDNWLITMSDVFSLLLIFFIMFVVVSRNIEGKESQGDEHQQAILPYEQLQHKTDIIGQRLKDSIVSEISNLDMGDEVSILATNKEITITMREKISFRPGDSNILPGSIPVLDNIADIIKRYPRFNVEIVGHTDDVPISNELYQSNWDLSVARAMSVLKYLINEHHVNPSRLSIKGNADQTPLVPNTTAENRAINRRVEIKLKENQA